MGLRIGKSLESSLLGRLLIFRVQHPCFAPQNYLAATANLILHKMA